MRLVVVSLVAAFALSNAAFAQSPAANPSGSVGNSPKQPANAVELVRRAATLRFVPVRGLNRNHVATST